MQTKPDYQVFTLLIILLIICIWIALFVDLSAIYCNYPTRYECNDIKRGGGDIQSDKNQYQQFNALTVTVKTLPLSIVQGTIVFL